MRDSPRRASVGPALAMGFMLDLTREGVCAAESTAAFGKPGVVANAEQHGSNVTTIHKEVQAIVVLSAISPRWACRRCAWHFEAMYKAYMHGHDDCIRSKCNVHYGVHEHSVPKPSTSRYTTLESIKSLYQLTVLTYLGPTRETSRPLHVDFSRYKLSKLPSTYAIVQRSRTWLIARLGSLDLGSPDLVKNTINT